MRSHAPMKMPQTNSKKGYQDYGQAAVGFGD
jgi:hypothetical protein